jgi:hypothetical protein
MLFQTIIVLFRDCPVCWYPTCSIANKDLIKKGYIMDIRYSTGCKNKQLILEAITLTKKMLSMSEQGIMGCENDACRLIFGVIRDCGYKIRRAVDDEQLEELFECNNS